MAGQAVGQQRRARRLGRAIVAAGAVRALLVALVAARVGLLVGLRAAVALACCASKHCGWAPRCAGKGNRCSLAAMRPSDRSVSRVQLGLTRV